MPLLLAKIKELDTGNLTFIVETVYKELSTQKAGVKKNAIEAKVREVGEKCKEKKVWVVKAEVRVSTRKTLVVLILSEADLDIGAVPTISILMLCRFLQSVITHIYRTYPVVH